MKKLAIVYITIDLDAKPDSSSTAHHEGQLVGKGPATLFEVMIVPQTDKPEDKLPLAIRTNLAHELGHVVASLAGTEANRDDPRSKPKGNRWTEDPAEAVIKSEQEAWEIAREISPGIDEVSAKRDLASYTDQREELDSHLKEAILLDTLVNGIGKQSDVN
jgi:hypothetical protein